MKTLSLSGSALSLEESSGWSLVRLGDVCKVRNGFAFDSEHFSRTDGTPLIRIRDLKTNEPSEFYDGGYDSQYLVESGALLVGMDGEFRCYRWKGPLGLLNQRVCQLLPDPDRLDPIFLLYALNDYLSEIEEQTAFTTVKHISSKQILDISLSIPPLREQRRIAQTLGQRMAVVGQARAAAEGQLQLTKSLVESYVQQSLQTDGTRTVALSNCLSEVSKGVGTEWTKYRLVGATRAGLAAAKEPVGKAPERYKPVLPGSVFYNPMRILLGSIAMIDYGDEPGITSPDYVVMETAEGILHPRWFYYWLRSHSGEAFIKTLTRGAVRERMLFRRLAAAEVNIPPWQVQCAVAERLKLVGQLRRTLTHELALVDTLPVAFRYEAFGDSRPKVASSNGRAC